MTREPAETDPAPRVPAENREASAPAERSRADDTPTMDHVPAAPLTDEDDTEGG